MNGDGAGRQRRAGWRRTTSVENADDGAIVELRHRAAAVVVVVVVVGVDGVGSSSSSSNGSADATARRAVVNRTTEVMVGVTQTQDPYVDTLGNYCVRY